LKREEHLMETMRLTDQQSLRIADLPENYRVVRMSGSSWNFDGDPQLTIKR